MTIFNQARKSFESNPADYTLSLLEQDIDAKHILTACVKWMSYDQLREMLRENELDPDSFYVELVEDEISNEEKYACEIYNERYSYSFAD